MLKDNATEKWSYTEHARVKHLLLEKYLKSWIVILGKYSNKIIYFDGFSGRGQYDNGNYGSPILAMKACQEVANFSTVKNLTYSCVFIEKDYDNYTNLVSIVEEEKKKYPAVDKIYYENGDFDTVINKLLDASNDKLVPSFFFIDPFGYTGVPFLTIKRILSIPKTEVFFSFMVRDINRFLKLPNQDDNFNSLFGDDSWKQFINLSCPERQNALRDLYIRKLIEENCAKYVWPFKICEDKKCAALYNLIYATNNFKGLDVMKSIMFNQSEHFAYLGPDEYVYQNSRYQLTLFDNNIESLEKFLLKEMPKNKFFTYEQIKESTYMQTKCIDKHYREALKNLEKQSKVNIIRVTSKTQRGLSGLDKIMF